MEDMKKEIPKMLDEHDKSDENQFRQIIPILLKKGLENLDLSMFDDETKESFADLYTKVDAGASFEDIAAEAGVTAEEENTEEVVY